MQAEYQHQPVKHSGFESPDRNISIGLLQALERYRLLWHVDYLSTVSGGGYIGAALTWFKSITAPKKGEPQKPANPGDEDDTFPFGTQRVHHAGIGGKVLAWLRSYGYYLTPGDGLTVWFTLQS